jgi:hypothetical protein
MAVGSTDNKISIYVMQGNQVLASCRSNHKLALGLLDAGLLEMTQHDIFLYSYD